MLTLEQESVAVHGDMLSDTVRTKMGKDSSLFDFLPYSFCVPQQVLVRVALVPLCSEVEVYATASVTGPIRKI